MYEKTITSAEEVLRVRNRLSRERHLKFTLAVIYCENMTTVKFTTLQALLSYMEEPLNPLRSVNGAADNRLRAKIVMELPNHDNVTALSQSVPGSRRTVTNIVSAARDAGYVDGMSYTSDGLERVGAVIGGLRAAFAKYLEQHPAFSLMEAMDVAATAVCDAFGVTEDQMDTFGQAALECDGDAPTAAASVVKSLREGESLTVDQVPDNLYMGEPDDTEDDTEGEPDTEPSWTDDEREWVEAHQGDQVYESQVPYDVDRVCDPRRQEDDAAPGYRVRAADDGPRTA